MLVHPEEWCVEAETAEDARELLATGQGHRVPPWESSTRGSSATPRVKVSRGKSHMDVKILERLNRSWIDKPTWQMPQPPTCQAINPAGPPGLGGVFFWEMREVPSGDCPCSLRKHAGIAPPNANRWRSMRLMRECGIFCSTWDGPGRASRWKPSNGRQINRPSSRLTKAAPQNAALREPKPPTPLQPRGSRREPR